MLKLHPTKSVICCKEHGFQIRVRSGGHDYEGLSYRSEDESPFVMVDLVNLRSVDVDLKPGTAWVQAGATLGELYYRIAEGSESYGSSSFGILVSWKLKLVPVPPTVAVFTIRRPSSEGAVDLVDKWQQIAPRLHEDLFIRAVVQAQGGNSEKREVEALFNSLFLRGCGELLQLMAQNFPELNLKSNDCVEMNWIHSVLYFAHGTDEKATDTLLDRGYKAEFFKAKSDFVSEPIPRFLWESIWDWFLEDGAGLMIMDPHGGKVNSISDSATPFPHRQGILYSIQYHGSWWENTGISSEKHMDWIRKLYDEMSPYVSKNPRAAYLGYRDLELGKNEGEGSKTSYSKAEVWGKMYFKDNFKRLAVVKGRSDAGDFFRNEQSIPPLTAEESSITLSSQSNLFKSIDISENNVAPL